MSGSGGIRSTVHGYDEFCRNNSWWLEDFALFTSLHRHYTGSPWSTWPDAIKYPGSGSTGCDETDPYRKNIEREKFLQYMVSRQWQALRDYCKKKGILLIGDIPMYVSYDSADVWIAPGIVPAR